MISLEIDGGALMGIFLLIIFIMIGPPIIFLVIGLVKRKKKPETAKIFYILSVAYLLIAGGICGSLFV